MSNIYNLKDLTALNSPNNMKTKIFIGVCILFLLSGCRKYCWKCTAITEYKYFYIKGSDTILVYYIDGSHPTGYDSLQTLGYFPSLGGYVEIPIDYSFCDGGERLKPYTKCYRVK
jgi:hypothetical protein